MPATVDWHPDFPQTVLLMVLTSPVTLAEVIEVSKEESELIKSAEHVIHTIIDLSDKPGIPDKFISNLSKIAQMPAANHPNSGIKIIVGADGVTKTFLNIFSKVYRKLQHVDTLDDANKLIEAELARDS